MRVRVRMSVYEHEQSRAKQNRSGRRREMVAVQCWAQIISLVAQGVRVLWLRA